MQTSPQPTPEANTVPSDTKEPWHAPLNRVTTVSKILAAIVFITLPFVGFWLGMGYGTEPQSVSPVLPVTEEVVVRDVSENPAHSDLIDQLLDRVEVPVGLVSSAKEASSRTRVALSNGFARVVDPQAEGDIPWNISVVNVEDYRLVADFNEDGLDDVAAVMVENTGGTGQFYSLVIFFNSDGQLQYVGAGSLGDRIDVRKIEYVANEFKVDIITQGPGEPMCCGTTPATLTFKLKDGELVRVYSVDEQKRMVETAGAEAKEFSTSSLESLLTSGLTSLLKEYDYPRGLMMSAYLREYVARDLSSPAISSLQDDMAAKYGPCWGIPEGQCRE